MHKFEDKQGAAQLCEVCRQTAPPILKTTDRRKDLGKYCNYTKASCTTCDKRICDRCQQLGVWNHDMQCLNPVPDDFGSWGERFAAFDSREV